MSKRILIVQGHPDGTADRFGRALAQAYADGARGAGHVVDLVEIAQLDFPLLRSKEDWEGGAVPAAVGMVQDKLRQAQHLVLFFPLWLGDMPALLKGFLEQLLRPGFALSRPGDSRLPRKLLSGRSARLVVTMGMPAPFYRFFFFRHSLRNLQRNILGFCGFSPIRESLIGLVEAADGRARAQWLLKMEQLGHDAS